MRSSTLLLLLSLTACVPVESSDLGQYQLHVNLIDQLGLDSHRVLVGTSFTVTAAFHNPACEVTSTTGVLSKTGSKGYSVDAAGAGTIEFAAPEDPCPELLPDRWSAIGVAPAAATGRWLPTADSVLMSALASPGPAGSFPDAIGRPLEHGLVAVAGQFALLPVLVDQSADERAEVRWSESDAVLVAPYEYQWPTTHTSYPSPVLGGRLHAGESLAPRLMISADEFELPPVKAVPIEEAVELQLVAVYERSHEPEREWGRPAGIIAIALDSDGHRIVGAPVEWSVTRGNVEVGGDPYLGDDVLLVSDCAAPPPRPRWLNATVEAQLAGQVASGPSGLGLAAWALLTVAAVRRPFRASP